MAKQLIFLRGKVLGEREIPTYSSLNDDARLGTAGTVQPSYLLICGHCGEVWGALVHDHPGAYYQFINSHCADHARWQSDATFTLNQPCYGHVRDAFFALEDWPLPVLAHDVAQLIHFRISTKLRKELTTC